MKEPVSCDSKIRAVYVLNEPFKHVRGSIHDTLVYGHIYSDRPVVNRREWLASSTEYLDSGLVFIAHNLV